MVLLAKAPVYFAEAAVLFSETTVFFGETAVAEGETAVFLGETAVAVNAAAVLAFVGEVFMAGIGNEGENWCRLSEPQCIGAFYGLARLAF